VSAREIRLKTVVILVGIAVSVAATAFVLRYRSAIQRTEMQLAAVAQAQARVIDAVARYDAVHAEPGDNPRATTLSQLREAQYRYRGIGRTGEIVLAERRDSLIYFLLPEPGLELRIPPPIPWGGERSPYLSRATAGESGVMRGPDYRGVPVLAAYEYLPFLEVALVAKMDLAEVRAPLLRAGLVTAAVGLVAILLGMLLHGRLVGPLIGGVLTSHDRLESGLRVAGAQSLRYATVFRSATDPILIQDLSGAIVEANRAAAEMSGWPAEELVGKPFTMLLPPDRHVPTEVLLARCARGEEVRDAESVWVTRDGQPRHVLLTFSLLLDEDGRAAAVSIMAKDITELVAARERLEDANRGLEAQVEERTQALARELRVARALAEEARRGKEVALVGDSIQVRALREQIERYARSDDAVLLGGPPGAGQEAVARAIHERSARADAPFIVVDCSRPVGEDTTPLLGISRDRERGKLSVAEGGTLYLDLVGFLPVDLQESLAEFVRSNAEARAKGLRPEPDVRIIAYLPADPNAAVAAGDLHPALGSALGRFRLAVASLSERRDDIEVLALNILQRRARALGKAATGFTPRATQALLDYGWPGNIRELVNVVERAVLVSIGTEIEIEDDLRSQTRSVGGYRLTRQLGRGGMGEVWLAEHALLKRPAAVKLTQTRSDATPEERIGFERRFRREAEVTSRLRSPHTVELYDFGVTEDGQFYYVMEYLEGFDLNALVNMHGPLPPERAIHLLYQACLSLGEAHDAGLVHRDIKPENLFVCQMGHDMDFVKVLDFGIVKETRAEGTSKTGTGMVIGTPAFIAPEVAGGAPPTPQADIYALGCVLFRLVTGRLVFDESTPMAMFVAHVERMPDTPSAVAPQPIPEALDRVILACLDKDPARRPQSALELRSYLRMIPLATPWTEERADGWWRAARRVSSVSVSPDLSTALFRDR
jgi:PAS domain S-box-containing protein